MDTNIVRYRTSASGHLVWMDDAFRSFARANGDPLLEERVLGTPLMHHITGSPVRDLYSALFDRMSLPGAALEFPYRCDSPELRRSMHMRIERRRDGGLDFVSTVLGTEARDPVPPNLLTGSAPPGAEQLLALCAWCKRVRLERWMEVDEALTTGLLNQDELGPVSHAACPTCEESLLAGV